MSSKDDASAMPPPPVPAFNKSPGVNILQPEFEALAQCLKDSIVKTSQIYKFYADVNKLDVMDQIPALPQKFTSALARDIERYDQLCDSIEAQLHRAITTLKRDLRQEEQKNLEEERRRKAIEVLSVQPMIEDITHPPGEETTPLKVSAATLLARRPSAVSISSLQRPQFPLKLDLSSASLKLTEEEATVYLKDIGSPVTLAPKTARPLGPDEFPSDLMIAFSSTPIQSDLVHGPSTMDLTMPDGSHMPEESSGLPLQLRDSATNNLDLDMDIDMAGMTGLFGEQSGSSGDLNSNEGVLSEFEIGPDVDTELFGEFNPDAGISQGESTNVGTSIPSPVSLLAQFSSPNLAESKDVDKGLSSVSDEAPFDLSSIDLSTLDSGFFAGGQNSEIDFRVDMELMDVNTSTGDGSKT